MAITDKEINLAQLSEELGNKALTMTYQDPKEKTIQAADGVELDEKQLEAAIAAHIARDDDAAIASAKQTILDRLGITAEEAALLLK
jgi:cell division protein FtsX